MKTINISDCNVKYGFDNMNFGIMPKNGVSFNQYILNNFSFERFINSTVNSY